MSKTNLNHLMKMKENKEKITCLTAYDAPFAHAISQANVDIILVGDSLGTTVQGQSTTVPVTLEDMCYHTQCVAEGNQDALLMADLPFMSYSNPDAAIENAALLMQAGAELVKMEGGKWLLETVDEMTQRGIPVCGHLGLTPQSVHQFGGYRVQGRNNKQAQTIIKDAVALQSAGARLLVLECIPSTLADEITKALHIPTIGIGAGPHTDGQVLVLHDMLGLTPGKPLSFVRNFMQDASGSIQDAIAAYHQAVKDRSFPGPEHSFE